MFERTHDISRQDLQQFISQMDHKWQRKLYDKVQPTNVSYPQVDLTFRV